MQQSNLPEHIFRRRFDFEELDHPVSIMALLPTKARLDNMSADEQLERLKETLWGGPDGEGLVHSVAKLAVSVTEVTNAIRLKMDLVHDENGDPINVRSLSNKIENLDRLLMRGLWILAGIGLMTVLILGRSLQIQMQGHP